MESHLRDYQVDCVRDGVAKLKEYRMVYLAMMMRTGKSITSLTISNICGYKNILFLTKKNAIDSVKHDSTLFSHNMNVTVSNYEQSSKFNRNNYDLIILDECNEKISAYPKMGKYAKIVKSLCKNKDIIFISATPTPESFSQIYHQLNMSDWSPFKEYKTFYKWAKDYVNVKQKLIGGFMTNDYSGAIEDKILKEIDHLFVRLTQKEANFSDDIKDVIHKVKMSDITKQMIESVRKDKLIKGNNSIYIADSASKEMQGVHQLGSGTLKIDDNISVTIDLSKVNYIKENFNNKKYAIFYNYKQERQMLIDNFDNITECDKEFNSSDDKIYIGQIVAKRSGVSLKTADILIFLSTPFSSTSYFQGRSRHAHKDRTGGCDVHFLIADCGIDSYVYKTVTSKEKFTTSHYRYVKI